MSNRKEILRQMDSTQRVLLEMYINKGKIMYLKKAVVLKKSSNLSFLNQSFLTKLSLRHSSLSKAYFYNFYFNFNMVIFYFSAPCH